MVSKRTCLGIGLALLSLVAPRLAAADPAPLAIGTPTYGGSGCEAGTVSTVFSPGEGALSIFFDDYQVTANNGEVKDRKGCVMTIPIQTAPGYRVVSLTVDYRGYAQSSILAWAYFLAKYQVNGKDAFSPALKAWPGNKSEDFYIQHTLNGPKPGQKFACGGSFNLGLRSEMEVKKLIKFGESMLILDSADLAPNMEIGVSVVPCT